jgi:hypothetical protein
MIWVVFATSLTAFFVAAKSHGRQLRLERELAGFDRVTFGGTNPPYVESLWRNDRVHYWRTFPVLLTFFLAGLIVSRSSSISLPFPDETRESQLLAWAALSFLWAFVWSFTLVGLASAVRLRRSLKRLPLPSESPRSPERGAEWEKGGDARKRGLVDCRGGIDATYCYPSFSELVAVSRCFSARFFSNVA